MQFFEIHRYPTRKRFPVYGSINRVYIDLASNELYYWEDGQYFKISVGVANNVAVDVEQLNEALGDIGSALDTIMGV